MDQPLFVQFDVERRHAQVVYQSQPSFDQWKAAIEAVLQDPRFQTGFGIILDRSRICEPATSAYMHQLVDFVDRHARKGDVRWAIVASDLASFGMGRMAEQLANKATIRTFKDRTVAELWLCDQAGSPS